MSRSVSIVGLAFCTVPLPSKKYRNRDKVESFLRTGPRSGNHSTTSKTSKERGVQVGAWLAVRMEGEKIVYTEGLPTETERPRAYGCSPAQLCSSQIIC